MLKGIHHAAIICSDYQVSKRFYTEILKLEIVDENYREARQSYKLDLALPSGAQIELFSFPNAPERPSFPEAQGLRHLACHSAKLIHPHQRCGYSDSPFASIHDFYTAGSRQGLEGGGHRGSQSQKGSCP